MRFALTPHPDCPSAAAAQISIDVTRPRADALALHYAVTGEIGALRVPALAAPARADELWQQTCFEAFLRAPGVDEYAEFNFSPSTQWAAYAFDGYRDGMRAFGDVAVRIETAKRGDLLSVAAEIQSPLLVRAPVWRLALSAVIEETSGAKSYWALKHPPGKPDFHHSDCFAAELSASERP